jgi:nicotinamide mononucleotide transporter
VTNLIGWWRWAHPLPQETDRKLKLKVSWLPIKQLTMFGTLGLTGTVILGSFAKKLHDFFPEVFSLPSAFPYLDSFVTVVSILATYLLIHKKIETWILWLMVDMVASYLYFARDIKVVGIEYVAFCFMAAYGLWNWIQEYQGYSNSKHEEPQRR